MPPTDPWARIVRTLVPRAAPQQLAAAVDALDAAVDALGDLERLPEAERAASAERLLSGLPEGRVRDVTAALLAGVLQIRREQSPRLRAQIAGVIAQARDLSAHHPEPHAARGRRRPI